MAPDAAAVSLLRQVSLRQLLGWARIAAVIAVATFWFVALRPQALGGPASYALVQGTSMNPLYHSGDVVIVRRQARYRVGDIVAYTVPKGTAGAGAQVLHRLIGGDETKGFTVQGDNRTAPDVWRPTRKQIVGTTWLHIPKAGTAIVLLHTPLFLASLAASIAVAWAIGRGPKRPDET